MKSRKLRIIRNVVIAVGCTIAVLAAILLLIKADMERWSDYEYYKTFGTADGGHDIVLYKSYPPFPPDSALKLKIVCKDNSSGKEVKQGEFRFNIPKNGEWFSVEEDTPQGCVFVLHNQTHDETLDLSWGEIFP